jgi:hypothetical protein
LAVHLLLDEQLVGGLIYTERECLVREDFAGGGSIGYIDGDNS